MTQLCGLVSYTVRTAVSKVTFNGVGDHGSIGERSYIFSSPRPVRLYGPLILLGNGMGEGGFYRDEPAGT